MLQRVCSERVAVTKFAYVVDRVCRGYLLAVGIVVRLIICVVLIVIVVRRIIIVVIVGTELLKTLAIVWLSLVLILAYALSFIAAEANGTTVLPVISVLDATLFATQPSRCTLYL